MIRTTDVDIRDDVARQGYCFVPAGKFVLSPAAQRAARALTSEWDSLEADPYLTADPCYRFRRHAQFRYDRASDRLHRLPDGPYYQSVESNHLYGGRERMFAPFTPHAAGNPFLAELIRFNARQLTRPRQQVHIHAHMVRIVAGGDAAGQPSPEGLHFDGFDFITIHLIAMSNTTGGETTLYGADRRPRFQVRLSSALDSVYVDDRRLLHDTTAIAERVPATAAHRDVLLLSYQHLAG